MNVYVMVDAEGCSGIYSSEQVTENGNRREEGRRLMTADVNACARALKEAGVEKVYVRDCHGSANSVLFDQLSDAVDYCISGYTGQERMAGLEDCDGVILLGYHAMAGTARGLLEHSMSSKAVQNYWINGELVGETMIDAAIAGEMGKPVMLVSGDDRLCAEASALLPWTITCEVKRGITWGGAILYNQAAAHALLRAKTLDAVRALPNMQPYQIASPITLRCEVTERTHLPLPDSKPYMRIIDGRTYEVTGATMREALFRL